MATPAKKAFDEIMKAGKPAPSTIETPTQAAETPPPAPKPLAAPTAAAPPAPPAPKPPEAPAPPAPKPPPAVKAAAPKPPTPTPPKRQKTKAALPTFPGVLPEPTPSLSRATEFLPTSTAALSEQLIEAPSVVFAAETGRKKAEPPKLGPPEAYEVEAYARQRITELETLLQRPNNTYEQVEGFYKQLSDNYRTLGKKEESEFFKGVAQEVRDAPRLYTAPSVAEKPLGPLTPEEFKKQQLERNLPLDERALQAARTYEAPRPSVVVARPGLQEVSVLRDLPEMLLLREGAEDLASLGKSIFLGTSAVVTRVPYINSEGAERIAARAFKENADKNRKAAEAEQRAEWEKLEAAGVRDSEEARKLYEEVVRKEADEKTVFSNYVSRRTQDLLNLWEADKVRDPEVLKDMERRARLRARADLVYWSTVSGGRFVPGSVLAGDVARAPANLLGFTREDIEKSRAPSAAKNAAIGLLNAWESDTVRSLLPQRRLMATGQVARAESVPGWLLNVALGIPDYAVTAFVRATHEEDRKGFYQDFIKAVDERKDVVTWRLEQDPDLQADLQSGDIDRVLSGLGTLSPYISMLILTPSTAEVGLATARPLSKPILASANATGIGARFVGQTPLIARQIVAAPRADRLKVANAAIRDAASRAMQQQASVIASEPRADALRAIDQYSKELARNGGDIEATLDSKRVDAATRKLLRDQIQLVLSQDADVQKFLELSGGSAKPPRADLENAPILGAGTVSADDLAAAQRGQEKYAQAYLDAATEVSRQFLATPTAKPVAPPPAGGTPPPPPAPTGPVSTTPVPAAPTPPMAPSIPPAAAAPTPAAAPSIGEPTFTEVFPGSKKVMDAERLAFYSDVSASYPPWVVAEIGGEVAGAAYVGSAGGSYRFDIIVAPKAQGTGIGARLLDQVIADYLDAEAVRPGLTISAEVVSPLMKQMLERRGFKERAPFVDRYGLDFPVATSPEGFRTTFMEATSADLARPSVAPRAVDERAVLPSGPAADADLLRRADELSQRATEENGRALDLLARQMLPSGLPTGDARLIVSKLVDVNTHPAFEAARRLEDEASTLRKRAISEPSAPAAPTPAAARVPADEARDLIAQIDAGGAVPAFISKNLERIARDNGVQIRGDMTPTDVIEALRNKVEAEAPKAAPVVTREQLTEAREKAEAAEKEFFAVRNSLVERAKRALATQTGEQARARLEAAYEAWADASNEYADLRGVGGPTEFPSIERGADVVQRQRMRQAELLLAELSGRGIATEWEQVPTQFRVDARRRLTKAQQNLANKKITETDFIEEVGRITEELTIKAEIERARAARGRARGADWVRSRLLAEKARGALDETGVDLADWFIQQNPRLADDLAISIRASEQGGVAGFYETLERLATLFKERGAELTATHEVLHHTERMLPEDLQKAIRKEWGARLKKQIKTASPEQRELLLSMLTGTDTARVQKAFEDGTLPGAYYQFSNPSEFWAVNASNIVAGRYEAFKGGLTAKAKRWLTEFAQKVKGFFGLSSDAPLIRGLNAVLAGDGTFVSQQMLAQGDLFRSIEPTRPLSPVSDTARNHYAYEGEPVYGRGYAIRPPMQFAVGKRAHLLYLALKREVEAIRKYLGSEVSEDFANRMANVDHVGSELPLYADGVTDSQFSKFRVRETPDSVPQTYVQKDKEPVEPVRPGAAEKLPVQRDWNPEVTWTKDGNDFWNWADSVAAAHPELPRARSLNDYLSSLLPWSDPLAKPEDVDIIRLEDIVFVDDPELSKVVGEHSQPVGMSGAPRVAETGGFTAIVVGFKDGKPLVQPLQWRGGAIEPAGAMPGRFSPVKEPVLANPETLLYKERGRSFGEAERRPLTDAEWKDIRAREKSVGTKNGALSLRYKNTDRFIKLAPPTRPAPGDFNINPDAARNYFSDLDIEAVRASIEDAARVEVPAPTRAEVPAPTRAEVPEEVVEAVLRNKDPEEVAQIGAPEDKPLEVPEEQVSQLAEQLSVEPDAEAFGVPPEARATFDSDAVSQILPPSLRPVTPVDRRKRAIEWLRAFGTPVMEGVPPVRPAALPPTGAVPPVRPVAPAAPGVPPVRPAAPPPAPPPAAAAPPPAPPPPTPPPPAAVPPAAPPPAPPPAAAVPPAMQPLFPSVEVIGQDLASARRTLELAAKRSMLGSLGYTWRRLKDYVLPANESQLASLSDAWREVAEGFEGTMQGAAEDLAHAGINIDIATDAPNTYAMDVAKNFSPSVRAALRNKHAEPSALRRIATAYLRNIQYLAPADMKGLHRIVAEWALGEDDIGVLSQRLFEVSGRLVEANPALTRARQDGDVQFSAALALQGAWYDEIGKASMRGLTWTREQAKDINGYLYGTLDPKDPNGSAAAARARRHVAGLLIPEAYRPPLRSVMDFLPQQPKGPAFEPVTSAFGTAGVRPTNLDIPDNVDEMRVRDAAVDELAALMEQFEALTESNVYIPRAVRNAFARAMDQVAEAARASDDSWKAGAGGAFAYYKQIVVLGAGPFPRSSQFTTDFYSEICNVNDAVGPLAAARVARRSMMAYLLGQPLVSLGTLMGDVLRSVLNGNTRRGQTARDFITATSWTREIDAMFTGDPAVIIDTPGFRGPASEVRKAAIGAGVFESFWARSLPDVALSVARVTYGNPVAKFARQVYEGFRQNLQDNSNLFATRRRLAVAYTLMESGVPLREAMRMTTDIAGNFAGELHPIDQMYTQYAFPFWSYRKFAARRALKTISSGARWFRIRYKTAEQLSDIATWVLDGSDEFGFHPDGMSEEFDPEDMANLRDRLAAENPQMGRDSSEFGQLVENTAEELYLAGAPNAPRKAITRYQQMIARYRAIGEERGYAEARLAVDRDMQQTGAVPTDARVLFAYYAPNPSNDMLPLWADDRTAVALQEARTQKTMSWYRAFGAAPRADQVRLAMLPQDPVVGGLTDVAAISGIASSVAWLAYHSGAALVSSDQVEKFPAGSFSSDIFAQGIETPAIQLGMRLAGAPTEDQGPMYVPSSIGPFLRDLGLAERDVVDVRGADILQGPETLRGFKWSIPRSTANVLYVLRPVGAPVFTLVTGATLAERMVGNPRYVGPQDFNDRFAALAEFSSGLRMYEFSPTAESLFAQKEVEKKVEQYVGLLPSEQRRPIQSGEQVIERDVRAFQNLPAEEQRRLVQLDVANLLAGKSESLRGTVALRAFLIQTGSSPEDVYAMNDAAVRGVAKTRASGQDVQRAIAAPSVTR